MDVGTGEESHLDPSLGATGLMCTSSQWITGIPMGIQVSRNLEMGRTVSEGMNLQTRVFVALEMDVRHLRG